ncbi:anti-sigma factor family protein [Acidovorax soli]|uniref:Putative zinc-finger n=1 Tax=Acidovorax soli TaxID=592050 RepID=A0A1H4BE90_9BURK|nr:zf-HC2 domain-containing protein [Acidovorax soli]SEA46417.1 Putative zinc-finger [Acidovorax soli]
MTCPRHSDLSAYADDMMAPAERARFSLHLAGCPACQHRLDEITALGQSLRALPSPRLGFDLAAQLNDRLHAPPPGRRPARQRSAWSAWLGWMPAGLAGGLALASGIWLGGLLLGGGAATVPSAGLVRVFDPVPPGGLCAAAEICRLSKGMP